MKFSQTDDGPLISFQEVVFVMRTKWISCTPDGSHYTSHGFGFKLGKK